MGQLEVQVMLQPLVQVGEYGTAVDITDSVLQESLTEITQFIDSQDYEVGIFAFGNLNLSFDNSRGKFNEQGDERSLFPYLRDRARIVINLIEREVTRSGEVVTDSSTTTTELFSGLLKEDSIRQDATNDVVTAEILSRESTLAASTIAAAAVNNGATITEALTVLLQAAVITEQLTFSLSKITPTNDLTIDDGTFFDGLNGLDAVKNLLQASNSVFFIDSSDEMNVTGRDIRAGLSVISLYGPNSTDGRENIIEMFDLNPGFHRIVNSVRLNDLVEVSASGSSDEYGVRQKQYTFDFITSDATLLTIGTALVNEFSGPKQEITVKIPISDGVGISILQSVRIYTGLKHTIEDDGVFASIWGQTDYGDADFAIGSEVGSFFVSSEIIWKVLEITHNLQDFTTTLKLRQSGTSYDDGWA